MSTRDIEKWHKSERQAERKAYQKQEKTPWQRYQELRNIQGRYFTKEESQEFSELQEYFSLREM